MEQSVSTMFEEYLQVSDLREASIDMKRRVLAMWVKKYGDPAMGSVTQSMAAGFKVYLRDGRQEISANGYLNNWKGFWSWAHKEGRISSNPFASVKPYKVDLMPRQTFTAEELSRLLTVAQGMARIRICLHLCGGRKGEVLNLTKDECHLDHTHPHVLIAKKVRTATTWPWKVKTHGLRWIAIPEVMRFQGDIEIRFLDEFKEYLTTIPSDQSYVCLEAKYIKKMLDLQREKKLAWKWTKDPTGNYSRMIQALQKRAEIKHPRPPKEFRAAFGTVMLEAVGLHKAAASMGHASTQTTLIYNRRSMESMLGDVTHNLTDAYRLYET